MEGTRTTDDIRDDAARGPADPPPRLDAIQGNRPGTRTYSVTTGPYLHTRLARVGLGLDQVLDEEVDDWNAGLEAALARGVSARAYAEAEEDRAVWEEVGGVIKLVAAIRADPGNDPEVTRFDRPAGPDEQPQSPPFRDPTSDEEMILTLYRTLGYREAFDRLTLSGPYDDLYWSARQRRAAGPGDGPAENGGRS